MIDRICIIGVGLIGGSLALALKQAGFCKRVIGAGRNAQRLEKAVELGVIDEYELDYRKAVAHADLVFLAVPLGSMGDIFEKIAPGLHAHTVVTDGGSAKVGVIEAARAALGLKLKQFVPGHPIAGTEQSGVEAAFDSLYENRRVILTPLEENTPEALATVRAMWQAAGASIDEMGARHHDLVLAGTSHLPHLLAYGLVDCLNRVDDVDEIFQFAAGGFRDFTRIASSDPVMWRDICLANGDAILAMLERFESEMALIKQAIESADGEQLLKVFVEAKAARDRFCMKY